jgi:hypothetical protein
MPMAVRVYTETTTDTCCITITTEQKRGWKIQRPSINLSNRIISISRTKRNNLCTECRLLTLPMIGNVSQAYNFMSF